MWLLCLTALPSLGGGDPAPRADSWPQAAAQETLADAAPSPFDLGFLLRTFYTLSAEEAGAGSGDLSGNVFEDVDLHLAWNEADLGWRLSADFDQGDMRLEDAHARWRHQDWFELTVGQFKPRVLRSGSIPDDGLLFRERTFLGAAFDSWDDGVSVGGHYDQFDYWLTVTDSVNGSAADHFWSARGEWALFDTAFADREGARGSPNHLRALLGTALFEDVASSASDGGGYSFDLALTYGPYSFHGEWADLDSAFARTIDVFNGHLLTIGDGKPSSATLSRRVGAHAEAALRFENADDADNTGAFVLGAGWMPAGGPARFKADLALVEGDTRDFSLLSVGLELGSSGQQRPFSDLY